MKKHIIACFIFVLFTVQHTANAATYSVDHAQSSITFLGTNLGAEFAGEFHEWDADIQFDPTKLRNSNLEVKIKTNSAVTGDGLYDSMLPSEDWFNSEQFPYAIFKSNNITRNTDGSFIAHGTLTLRNITKDLSIFFSLYPPDLRNSTLSSSFEIQVDRLAFDIGKIPDPEASYVSRFINIKAKIVAVKG